MENVNHFPGPPSPSHAWTGTRYLDVINPDPYDINFEDMVRGLCGMRRYNRYGSTRPWTVGQHSLVVLYNAEQEGHTSPTMLLTALLHDLPETPLGDMVRPLKREQPSYREVEDRMWGVMAKKWRLYDPMPSCIKRWDDQALAMEKAELVSPRAGPWPGVPDAPRRIPPCLFDLSDEACEKKFHREAAKLFARRAAG
jgi:hypothetical protein